MEDGLDDQNHDGEISAEVERHVAIASGFLPELYDAWHSAMATYQSNENYRPAVRAEHDDTTAANIVRCHMLHEITRGFDGRSGFSLLNVSSSRLWVMNYRDVQLWRFKKVDEAGLHRNVRTGQQDDFDDNLPIEGLPDGAIRLTCGYQISAGGDGIERIVVARILGRGVHWAAQVNVLDGVASYDLIPKQPRFPGTGRTDFDTARARRQRRG
jgi:hypothetical protein